MTDTLRAPGLRRIDAERLEHEDVSSASISDLISQVAGDLSELVRKEVELAKAEATTEVKKAAKAAGMFGGAGFAGYMVAVFATITAMAALAIAIPWWAAALVVTAIWAIVGAALALRGRAEMRRIRALPKTTASLKEDAEWARHPIS